MGVRVLKEKIIDKCMEWAKVIILALIMGLGVTYFAVPTVVSGESMYPTLNTEDYLIINKVIYKNDTPNRGDIVVFETELENEKGNKKNLVKRIVGLPGEKLSIKNGDVYINDKLIKEPYVNNAYTAGDIELVIPKNQYFAMGDNRIVSKDSRDEEVGLVNESEIIGKANIRLFPFKSLGIVN